MLVLAVSCGRTGKSGRQAVSDSAAAGQPFPQLVVPKMIEDPTALHMSLIISGTVLPT